MRGVILEHVVTRKALREKSYLFAQSFRLSTFRVTRAHLEYSLQRFILIRTIMHRYVHKYLIFLSSSCTSHLLLPNVFLLSLRQPISSFLLQTLGVYYRGHHIEAKNPKVVRLMIFAYFFLWDTLCYLVFTISFPIQFPFHSHTSIHPNHHSYLLLSRRNPALHRRTT